MKRWNFLFVITAVCMVLGVTSATAEHRAQSFMLSPMAGGFLFDSDMNLEDEMTFGGAVGYNFTENIGVEVAYNYFEAEFEAGVDNILGDPAEATGHFYRVDGLYHFMTDNALVPYLVAGVGQVYLDVEKTLGNDDESEFATNLGGGVKYFVHEDVALRGDIRNVQTYPELNWLASVGVTVYLGGGGVEPKAVKKAEASEAVVDSDGDGVADDKDKCPGTPSGAKVDMSGCLLDSDKDGVVDLNDKCPGTPAGVSVDASGCPVDADGDGVVNADDQCPGTPSGAEVDERGCWVIKGLTFGVGKANITATSYGDLDKVVAIMKNNPDLKVEIQGHTDSQGKLAFNQTLSEKRAKAVNDYLTEKGVDVSRMSYRGFGPSNPAASNDTAEGRAKNRRVEILPVK